MDDLIRRQVLLAEKFVRLECALQANKDAHFDVYKRGWNDALQTVYDNAPSAQTEQVKYVPDTKAIPSSRDCVDLSERVTATFYDVEHEEWSQKTVTIQDVLDSVCDEYTVLPSEQQWIPCSERLPEPYEDKHEN